LRASYSACVMAHGSSFNIGVDQGGRLIMSTGAIHDLARGFHRGVGACN
jgi:hypothetical protein